ncbi:MAG: ThuA domain-containing protein [Paenibacillaceae bacterium]
MLTNYKKAILLGDYTNPPYHPLDRMERTLIDILKDQITVVGTEDYDILQADNLNNIHLCISYTDCWNKQVTSAQAAGLLSYVSNGGGLLVLHTGISLQNKYELCQMIGAKFTGHPPLQKLQFEIAAAAEHEILDGFEPFSFEDEPYQFDFDPFTEKMVLFEYTYENQRWPAAWVHEFGLGRIVYLMPGHTVAAFHDPTYRKILRNSVEWLTK